MPINQVRVAEMTSAERAEMLRRVLGSLPGVWRVETDLAERAVRVEHTAEVSLATLLVAIRRAGYSDVAVLV